MRLQKFRKRRLIGGDILPQPAAPHLAMERTKFCLYGLQRCAPCTAQKCQGQDEHANVGAFDQAGILVNIDGKRFVNEKASNRHILDPMLQNANGQGYVFMDQKSWEGFYKRERRRLRLFFTEQSLVPLTVSWLIS